MLVLCECSLNAPITVITILGHNTDTFIVCLENARTFSKHPPWIILGLSGGFAYAYLRLLGDDRRKINGILAGRHIGSTGPATH